MFQKADEYYRLAKSCFDAYRNDNDEAALDKAQDHAVLAVVEARKAQGVQKEYDAAEALLIASEYQAEDLLIRINRLLVMRNLNKYDDPDDETVDKVSNEVESMLDRLIRPYDFVPSEPIAEIEPGEKPFDPLPDEDSEWDDDEESVQEFKDMLLPAYKGSSAAMGAMGDFYLDGIGTGRSYMMSACWYRAAIRTRDEELPGRTDSDWRENLERLKANGYDGDPFLIAEHYLKQTGDAEDDSMVWEFADFWVTQAAKDGNTAAMTQHGMNLLFGRGCEKDLQEAKIWLEKAISDGHKEAYDFLRGVALAFHQENNFTDSKALWEKIADEDDDIGRMAFAKYMIGSYYQFGYGVPNDEEKARYWLTCASEQGAEGATSALDEMNESAANKAICPWCGRESSYDKLQKGVLLQHDNGCGKIFRYVDRYNSRRFGMEKCEARPGVTATDACPTCGGRLEAKAIIKDGKLTLDKNRTCPTCAKWDIKKIEFTDICDILEYRNGIIPGYFTNLEDDDFSRDMFIVCPYCSDVSTGPVPGDVGLDQVSTECGVCGKSYTYCGTEDHSAFIKKTRETGRATKAAQAKNEDLLQKMNDYLGKKDYKNAETVLLQIGEAKNKAFAAMGQHKLGVMYFLGYPGILKDNNKAAYWLKRAADNGHKEAEKLLWDEFQTRRT